MVEQAKEPNGNPERSGSGWTPPRGSRWAAALLVLGGIVALARYDFLLFHVAVETLSVVLYVAVFSIGWNTRAFVRNNLLLVVAVASLPIGVFDALHMLSYRGMGVLDVGSNEPTQLWIGARAFESLSFVVGALLIGRRALRPTPALWASMAIGLLLVLAIHPLHVFPTCYVEGVGLTRFKIGSELAISALFFGAVVLLWKRRASLSPVVLHPLLIALVGKVLSEIFFTAYVDVYGMANELGHVFKVVSAMFMYAALVDGTLRQPYRTLFKELAASKEELQVELGERRRAQAQLAEAKEAAEAANRAKSDFLANMSHEVRTPMNAIRGATELVLGTNLNAEQREYLNMARTSADALLRIIDDVLDFSKIEAGRFDLDHVELDLHETVERATESLALAAQQKGLELACTVHRDVPRFVLGDPGRLRQVLINLLGNAVKFTEKGSVVLRVTAPSSASQERQAVRFAVADTGPGIPPSARNHLFSSFFQADSSLTRRVGGTGLGLAISREIVKHMGGSIHFETSLEQGTTFFVDLELTRAPDRSNDPDRDELAELRGRRAMIVEQHAATSEALANLISGLGMEPESASSLAAATDILRAARAEGRPFRLALVQAELMAAGPDVDPIGRDGLIEGPVITLAAARVNAPASTGAPAALQLIKPVRRSALVAVLRRAADARSSEPQLEPSAVGAESVRPLQILLAEDNPVNQRILVAFLQRRGHRVAAVSNGVQALSALENVRFDVVLMDVQMPELDGLEATRRLRARSADQGGDTPVIGLTAHAMHGDRERCLASGMSGYLAKPVSAADLLSAVESAVSAGRVQRAETLPTKSIDLGGFRVLVGNDDALAREIIESFLEDLPKRIDALREAIAVGDAAALMRAAHNVKGAVSTFGARKAQCLAGELETLGRDERLDAAMPAFERLLSELDRVRHSLASEISRSASQ